MSKGFQATAHISATTDVVWVHLTDWRRAPEWMNGIDEMRLALDEPVGEGTRILFKARGRERESTIDSWSPPRRLALRSRQGGMTALYEYTCEPEEGGTRLTLNANCEARGIGWRAAAPLIRFMMKRVDSGQVTALKRLIEASPH
jgi:uncharacterized protein YndB with AHSA1/START domain